MKYYQEITIVNSLNGSFFKMWSKLFTQVHLVIVEQAKIKYGEDAKVSDIGISFPEYQQVDKNGKKFTILGSKLRVFATNKAELEQLNLPQKLSRLLDYVHIKSINSIPDEIKDHLTVKRFRQDRNIERLTRRYAKRKSMSIEEAKAEQIGNYAVKHKVSIKQAKESYEKPKLKSYPYIIMNSLSRKEKFSLEIIQQEVPEPQKGQFNTYGMSSTATVPHW